MVIDTYVPRDLAEMRRAVRAIAAMGESGDVAWLQALTGLRINEVCGLRISEIDEEAKTLTIPASRMKANVAHRVMLSSAAWDVIERRMEMAREDGRDHLFPAARDPSRVLSTNAAQKIFAGVVAVGQLHPKFTSHAWRRALGTWVMEACALLSRRARYRLLEWTFHRIPFARRHGQCGAMRKRAWKNWSFCSQTLLSKGSKPALQPVCQLSPVVKHLFTRARVAPWSGRDNFPDYLEGSRFPSLIRV
jgi:integrase